MVWPGSQINAQRKEPQEEKAQCGKEGRTSVGLSGISRFVTGATTDQTNTWMLLPVDMKPHHAPALQGYKMSI